MTPTPPALTASVWRTRRAAALSGIVFGVLLLTAMTTMRIAVGDGGFEELQGDERRRTLIRFSLDLVPYGGIAFLWFIGVVREQLGEVEDRLFSTVFLGSGLLFVVLMFAGAVTTSSMVLMLDSPYPDPEVWSFGRDNAVGLISVYAMRMAAVFTLSVSTAALRTASLPRSVCLSGYGVAVVLLLSTASQTWIPLLFPGWVLVLSVLLLRARPDARVATPA